MTKIQEKVIQLIKNESDDALEEIVEFIGYLKYRKKGQDKFADLIEASSSSISFWMNEEDEVWNDV